ncbi:MULTISPECIES: ABC transporter permease [Streptomyces]|uniref:FtsX-like permease family protein n=2 Tax=Streptomyces TaxID=1883 RepID=A0ABU4K2E8_9ACTN|nr:FtsX-like permease family protein [Streptomyces roseolus]MDX2291931.1 FtsX-like permease family protein [Streptomyces roseolus]
MSAVWSASRAAVKRRRVQTFVIGLVVLCSSVTVLLALSLLRAASGPFDRAFAQQRGAHAVVAFDAARVSDERLGATARRPGVEAAAGPFAQAVVTIPEDWLWMGPGALTVVGRADPAGPVDRLELLSGRWATAPGELVLNWPVGGHPNPAWLGQKLRSPGAPALTVVGFAVSMSRSANAWVTPDQAKDLRPATAQMLYRFTAPGSEARLRADVDRVTAGLPAGAVTGTQSHVTLKRAFSAQAEGYLPFMTLFGVLGLLVSVLIVGNVVSGAVVSGYRHIGVLKAIGYTPNQVVAVYLTMLSVPTVLGTVLGTLVGTLIARPVLSIAFAGIETGTASVDVGPWLPVVCLLGVPALVLLTALVPALRAHRLPAARAISAGSAPGTRRGLRVQRRLGGSRLPRAVSLGIGRPFARPGRALLTMAAVALGVTTVTLTTGLTGTLVAYGESGKGAGGTLQVRVGAEAGGQTPPVLGDGEIERRLRAVPGVATVTARSFTKASLAGAGGTVFVDFYRGDRLDSAEPLVQGRRPTRPGEVVAGPAFLAQHGFAVGDRTTLHLAGRRLPVTFVGMLAQGNAQALEATWQARDALAPTAQVIEYLVRLAPAADADGARTAVAAMDPGLHPELRTPGNAATTTVVGFSTVFTVLLSVVAALGVFNTVLLDTRERRRDLGMLKSIGMTPRQIVLMTVTSVAGPGLVAGLAGIPIGIAAHRLLVDHVGFIVFPESMKDVYHLPQLLALALAGVAIAVLGALLPARTAARLTIAEVLHNE